MPNLRILITNNTLASRAGSELYVRDVATALLDRGHTPIAYSTNLGEVARELQALTVPVIDNLSSMSAPPDVIHGHHNIDLMTALLHFPRVPAICFSHGWLPWQERPLHFPRIRRYVAVSHAIRDKLLYEHNIPEGRIKVLLNFVDLRRFVLRSPLPPVPKRALVFSNSASEDTYLNAVRQACARSSIPVDVIGLRSGNACTRPEEVIGNYDLIFARGRSALEALAVGVAVVLCDVEGAGPIVTTAELERLQKLNFGLRALQKPVEPEVLAGEIARYNAEDAAEVSRRIRQSAGHEAVVEELLSLYEAAIEEQAGSECDLEAEARAASGYLRWLTPMLQQMNDLGAERERAQNLLAGIRASRVYRLMRRVGKWKWLDEPAREVK